MSETVLSTSLMPAKAAQREKSGVLLGVVSYEAVSGRLERYFKECEENGISLTISGLSLALGTTTKDLAEILKGNTKVLEERLGFKEATRVIYLVKRAATIVAQELELEGRTKQNPAMAIFLLKNLGMTDQAPTIKDKEGVTLNVNIIKYSNKAI